MAELLSDRLQRGQLTINEATFIAAQVAAFLLAFQGYGRAHGALSAAVVSVEDLRVTGINFDVERPQDACAADDVFALGQILYQMVTGFPTASAVAMQPLRADVPPALDALTQSMLAAEPAQRPSLESVSQQLSAFPPPAPDETAPLQALLEQQRREGRWSDAIATISKLVEMEPVGERRAAWSLLGAQISRDELGLPDEACEFCAAALDARSWDTFTDATVESALAPFHMIETILSQSGDVKALERATRGMIQRLKNVPALVLTQAGLFDKLGDIYLAKLDQPQSAKVAFELARSLDPANDARTAGIDRDAMLAQLANLE